MLECKFCDHVFKTEKSLYVHQRRARYCLKIQKEKGHITTIHKFECADCKKKCLIQSEYDLHVLNCHQRLVNENEKLKEIIAEKDKLIAKLKIRNEKEKTQIYKEFSKENSTVVQEIAKQPRTQTQTNNQLLLLSPLDLSDKEKVKQIVENGFTHDHFLSGQKGVAKFAVDNLLKDDEGKLKYICTDPSKVIFKYRSSQGEVERDVKARKLTDLIVTDVLKKSTNLVNDKKEDAGPDQFIVLLDNYTNIRDMIEDNGEFRGELAMLTIVK